MKNYTFKNRKLFLNRAFETGDGALLQDLLDSSVKLRPDDIDEYLAWAEREKRNDFITALLEYKNKTYTRAELSEYEKIKTEKELGLRERDLADWRKIFKIKPTSAGYIINGVVSEDGVIEVPDHIGKRPVIMAEPTVFYNKNCKIYGSWTRNEDFEAELASIKSAQPGDTVLFGSYPGGNALPSQLPWRVLERTGSELLLITENGIDGVRYNDAPGTVTWRNSAVREWLNGPFYELVFSKREKTLITQSKNENKYDPYSPEGNITGDRVFLLSRDEALKLFPDNSSRICHMTGYAASKGVLDYEEGKCRWWLRSPAMYGNNASHVRETGVTRLNGYGDDYGTLALRPAIRLTLKETKA